MKRIHKHFFEFLRKHNAAHKFVVNFYMDRDGSEYKTLSSYLANYAESDYIIAAFEWSRTIETLPYWSHLDDKRMTTLSQKILL